MFDEWNREFEKLKRAIGRRLSPHEPLPEEVISRVMSKRDRGFGSHLVLMTELLSKSEVSLTDAELILRKHSRRL
jgi:hypothetical protein